MHKTLIAMLAAAGVWIIASSRDLPARVASHFGADGVADGFMSRRGYVGLMLLLAVGMPALLGLCGPLLRRLPNSALNLPNRNWWLAPQRREATLAALSTRLAVFALGLCALLCFVHALVVAANARQPAVLDSSLLGTGMTLFGVGVVLWLIALVRRFHAQSE